MTFWERAITNTAATLEDIAGGRTFGSLHSRWLLAYVVAIAATGVATVAATLPGLPQHHWSVLVLFGLVAAAAEFWTVPAAAEGGVSLCFVITYTAAILFGPCFAALTAVAGELAYDAERRLWRASTRQALRDIKATRRSKDLLNMEAARELI